MHWLRLHRSIAVAALMLAALLASCGDEDTPALPGADSIPPAQITDLRIVATGEHSITMQWTAPGDDGRTGKATSYDIRWSHDFIMSDTFVNANIAANPPLPEKAGTSQQFTVDDIDTTLVTYVTMIASDEVANASQLSNGIRWSPRPAPVVFKTVPAFKDNTIYEEDGAVSNGAIQFMRVGSLDRSGRTLQRRGLIAFAVAENIPAGAVIDSVQLLLHVSGGWNANTYRTTIHRVTADWDEGTSDSGDFGFDGAPATAGDATWTYRFFDTQTWTTPGGDFVATPSGARLIRSVGNYRWKSTPQMTSDVQGWLDTPASNFGWILIGDESGEPGTAKRFDTHENPDAQSRPVLRIFYTVP